MKPCDLVRDNGSFACACGAGLFATGDWIIEIAELVHDHVARLSYDSRQHEQVTRPAG